MTLNRLTAAVFCIDFIFYNLLSLSNRRPRSSSLHKYLPSPNDIAARGKDLLSRWKPMSYVAVPLHSPTPGPSTPSTAANVDFSEKSPRPLGSATAAAIAPVTPTAAELALPSAESPGVYSLGVFSLSDQYLQHCKALAANIALLF